MPHSITHWFDDLGNSHPAAVPPYRIVCLVPSITELLFDLGLGEYLVGRTGFCVHPAPAVKRVPKVGGTKDVDIEKIRALRPTHALVNVDENPKWVAQALAEFVAHIIVTHPLDPLGNVKLFRLLGGIFDRQQQAGALESQFTQAYQTVVREAEALRRQRVLYLIWQDPWMTISRDTYISRTLALVGWDTIPAQAAARYPELPEIAEYSTEADWVLLSSEPYPFREKHLAEIRRALPAGSRCRVTLMDGEMVSWYGSRAIQGLTYLLQLRLSLDLSGSRLERNSNSSPTP
ncbi:MAG: helical backbone metal receptor [Proteobacteria bacterium]|nr:helical backbone metal receptor [Pseudomonadota bacterium]